MKSCGFGNGDFHAENHLKKAATFILRKGSNFL